MSRILEGRGIILQRTITIVWIRMNPQGPRRNLWGVQPLLSSGWKGFLIFFPHPCTDFNTGLNSCCGHLSGDTHVCLYQHQNICFFVVFSSITKYRVAEVVSSWFLIELIWLDQVILSLLCRLVHQRHFLADSPTVWYGTATAPVHSAPTLPSPGAPIALTIALLTTSSNTTDACCKTIWEVYRASEQKAPREVHFITLDIPRHSFRRWHCQLSSLTRCRFILPNICTDFYAH